MSSQLYSIAVAAFVLVTGLATTVLNVLFAVALGEIQRFVYKLAIVAAVLEFVATLLLSVLLASHVVQSRQPQTHHVSPKAMFVTLSSLAISCVIGAGFSLATSVWLQLHSDISKSMFLGQDISGLVIGALVICPLAFLGQCSIVLIAMRENGYDRSTGAGNDAHSESFHLSLPIHHNFQSEKSNSDIFSGSHAASQSPEPGQSQRSSFQQQGAPMSPHTEQANHTSSFLHHNVHTNSQGDNLMMREVSIAEHEKRDMRDSPTLRGRLESGVGSRLAPIPGSRPNSPAKPLDGPFLISGQTEGARNADSSRPVTAASDTSTLSNDDVRKAPRHRTKSPRSPTPVLDESHIHPLFRTDSPLPPPTPTLGTTVTASAFGGQIMSVRSLSRASSRSRSRSPSLSSVPRARSRAGSVNASLPGPTRVGSPVITRSISLEAVKSGGMRSKIARIPSVPSLLIEKTDGQHVPLSVTE